MNRVLAETVVQLFRRTDENAVATLSNFQSGAWQRSFNWLDASGMALYLAQHLGTHALKRVLPTDVAQRLARNLADNAERTSHLFHEFVRINRAFQELCIAYAVTKGFALVPDYCPDPSLRYQLDFDFLVHRRDSTTLAGVMEALGYELVSDDGATWHFKKGEERLPRISQLYQPRPQHAVELHFGHGDGYSAEGTDRPGFFPVKTSRLNDFEFPVLADVPAFIAQASHLFRHMRSEWTRASWVLEFRRFLLRRTHDHAFWHAVHDATTKEPGARIAIAAAATLADLSFGVEPQGEISSLFAAPERVKRWVELYWRDVLLSDFPGNKLYLLLEREISSPQDWRQLSRSRLYPLHRAPRVVQIEKKRSKRITSAVTQMRFVALRLRFHVIEGLRYWRESRRWKRTVAEVGRHVTLRTQIARETQ